MNQQDFLNNFINLLGVAIGLLNYNMNLTQDDKQEMLQTLHEATQQAVDDIHNHLQNQDEKIDMIIKLLRNEENGD